jgi:hypothetical protein
MQAVQVPVSVVWGARDPWEKVEWGREFAKFQSVEVGRLQTVYLACSQVNLSCLYAHVACEQSA